MKDRKTEQSDRENRAAPETLKLFDPCAFCLLCQQLAFMQLII